MLPCNKCQIQLLLATASDPSSRTAAIRVARLPLEPLEDVDRHHQALLLLGRSAVGKLPSTGGRTSLVERGHVFQRPLAEAPASGTEVGGLVTTVVGHECQPIQAPLVATRRAVIVKAVSLPEVFQLRHAAAAKSEVVSGVLLHQDLSAFAENPGLIGALPGHELKFVEAISFAPSVASFRSVQGAIVDLICGQQAGAAAGADPLFHLLLDNSVLVFPPSLSGAQPVQAVQLLSAKVIAAESTSMSTTEICELSKRR